MKDAPDLKCSLECLATSAAAFRLSGKCLLARSLPTRMSSLDFARGLPPQQMETDWKLEARRASVDREMTRIAMEQVGGLAPRIDVEPKDARS